MTELPSSETNTNTFISVLDDNTSEDSLEEVTTKSNKYKIEEIKSTKRPARNRGRITFRGQKNPNT